MITVDIEAILYKSILDKADSLGCIIHAIGGIEDHIHMVVSVPPKISVADFVGQIKATHLRRDNFINQ